MSSPELRQRQLSRSSTSLNSELSDDSDEELDSSIMSSEYDYKSLASITSKLLEEQNLSHHEKCHKNVKYGHAFETDPKVQKRQEFPQEPNCYDGTKYKIISTFFFIAVVCVIVIMGVYFMRYSTNSNSEDAYDLFKKSISKMRQQFPKQTGRNWKVLGAAVHAVMKLKNPTQPSVIMVAALKKSHDELNCILNLILEKLRLFDLEDDNSLFIDGLELRSLPLQKAKEEIFANLSKGFEDGKHLAIIDHFDVLPGKMSQALHTFCDHENAPYKNVIIILVVREELNYSVNNVNLEYESDKLVAEFLQNKWNNEFNIDDSNALLSRIANRVMIFTPEESDSLSRACDIL